MSLSACGASSKKITIGTKFDQPGLAAKKPDGTLAGFDIDVAMDAAPTPGRHRLIVMSHGTGGSALSDHALAATLARAGFVVAQPQHAGDNHADLSQAGPVAWDTRPREVSAVIDALEQACACSRRPAARWVAWPPRAAPAQRPASCAVQAKLAQV